MESKIAFNTFIILILRNPKILLLTLRRSFIMRFSAESKKEKKQLEIKNKILERTGFDQVFEGGVDNSDYSDYNSIKDAVYTKLRY